MKHKKRSHNLFANLVLDKEEELLESAFEKGEYEADPASSDTIKMLEEAAIRHLELNTSKPITIRINQLDLVKVKARAKIGNIPYQTLLGSLIHQYAEGERQITL